MRVRPFGKKYWEQSCGLLTDAEFGAAYHAAIVTSGAGKGQKKIKRAGRRAVQLKRKAQR
jgi:hypothetical protein